jgi:hypothetical protein
MDPQFVPPGHDKIVWLNRAWNAVLMVTTTMTMITDSCDTDVPLLDETEGGTGTAGFQLFQKADGGQL